MKLALYAICKNEEHNVRDFLACAIEADEIHVLDTGSTDGTLAAFDEYGADLVTPISLYGAELHPFRFDVARNMVLEQIRKTDCDWAIFLDMDERLPAGWREVFDSTVREEHTAAFLDMCLRDGEGQDSVAYRQLKAHRVNGYHWIYSAHEVLIAEIPVNTVNVDIRLEHLKDNSKPRSYLPLLADDFEHYRDHRSCYYYGRELYYAGEYEKALVVLTQAEDLPGCFDAQQIEVYRTMFYCSKDIKYLHKALALNPTMREIYYDLAIEMRDRELYYAAVGYLEQLLEIEFSDNFILFSDPGVWSWKPYDLLAECFYHLNLIPLAFENSKLAVELNPDSPRLQENHVLYKSHLLKTVAEGK